MLLVPGDMFGLGKGIRFGFGYDIEHTMKGLAQAEDLLTGRVAVTAVRRCGWAPLEDPAYLAYHDEEWGVPVHDDTRLFEMLTLEGAQAGLSWSTILHKRDGYRRAFAGFDPAKVARFDAREDRAPDAGCLDRPQPPEDRVDRRERPRDARRARRVRVRSTPISGGSSAARRS